MRVLVACEYSGTVRDALPGDIKMFEGRIKDFEGRIITRRRIKMTKLEELQKVLADAETAYVAKKVALDIANKAYDNAWDAMHYARMCVLNESVVCK